MKLGDYIKSGFLALGLSGLFGCSSEASQPLELSDDCQTALIDNSVWMEGDVPKAMELIKKETLKVAILTPENGALQKHPIVDEYFRRVESYNLYGIEVYKSAIIPLT